ncbi:hypothetical protein MZO42_02695 [Sphingomonas psychrotolerans]|uniref:TonB C-terminal domain-containing protein n=1 Tax=Sphingomonas psychrotolerans TaxID=1327635 RepID=A0ABU3N019_9SPHN|nr:hypothetical protein [Sphingomonas psychrotolerans]MDT8757596.1 hypothetical protein [Sphingomonas psychrotolerans]
MHRLLWLALSTASPPQADAAAAPITSWYAAAVIDVSEAGDILSCVDEQAGRPPAGLVDPCVNFKGEIPQPMLDELENTGLPRRVTIEMAMAADGAPRPAFRYYQTSQTPSALASVAFEVSKDGAIENCRKLDTGEERWTVKLPALCSIVRGPYRPLADANGRPRRTSATFTVAFSTAR